MIIDMVFRSSLWTKNSLQRARRRWFYRQWSSVVSSARRSQKKLEERLDLSSPSSHESPPVLMP